MDDDFSRVCNADPEFGLAARFWTGSLRIDLGSEVVELALRNGRVVTETPADGGRRVELAAPVEVWDKILAPIPPPFFNDVIPAQAFGLTVGGDGETFHQYYPAVRRAVDLLRSWRNR